jgi:hypothetical protein
MREVARIQEADLGPLHPDLANTLNNLAIVAEQTGQPEEAESFLSARGGDCVRVAAA